MDFLKAGIVAADAVTTVSPAYAREILEPPAGEMLEDVLRERAGGVLGAGAMALVRGTGESMRAR